jgi:hypothetical protein
MIRSERNFYSIYNGDENGHVDGDDYNDHDYENDGDDGICYFCCYFYRVVSISIR